MMTAPPSPVRSVADLRGRRIFRMTPLHHHFELVGWAEEKITLRFWIVAALVGLLGFSIFLASLDAF